MEALRQIAAFEEAVQAQDMATARGDRSGDAGVMTARQACARLQKLITQACTRVLTDTATDHMLRSTHPPNKCWVVLMLHCRF